MCKPAYEIHLCTCSSLDKKTLSSQGEELIKNEYHKTQFIWKLSRYLGEKDCGMMGQMIMPVEQLDQDLKSSFLIKELNSKNIFDFDYSPSEGDNLEIRKEYIYKKIKGKPRQDLYDYMSFIYRNGRWVDGVYDVFSDKIKGFKKGKLRYISK